MDTELLDELAEASFNEYLNVFKSVKIEYKKITSDVLMEHVKLNTKTQEEFEYVMKQVNRMFNELILKKEGE